jgi:NADPH:quinone reductase-like Zn-dependent oxidoreductase
MRALGFRSRIASRITAGILVRKRSFEALREEVAMKAAQVVKYGDAVEGIELREVPEPAAPKSGEALVGVEFSPINFNDLMVVWGIYAWKPELPATMGNEGAGKVIAIGEGVSSVKVGDRRHPALYGQKMAAASAGSRRRAHRRSTGRRSAAGSDDGH